MRLPSLQALFSSAAVTARRFPFVLASALGAFWASAISMTHEGDVSAYGRFFYSFSLGLPLFAAISLFAERQKKGALTSFLLSLIGVLILALYYWGLPNEPVSQVYERYLQLNFSFHLLVAFLPFLIVFNPLSFWRYNQFLFVRFIQSTIFSVILFLGVAGLLGLFDFLFLSNHIPGKVYSTAWCFVTFVFNTWYFLGGIPLEGKFEVEGTQLPRSIRILGQYILIPILTLYLVLLLAYGFKILVTGHLPNGRIAYLVSAVSVLGVFTMVLMDPYREAPETGWMKRYVAFFYGAVLALMVLFFVSLYERLAAYGVTERRYFLLVLGVWLTGVSLYTLIKRSQELLLFPLSLFLVSFLSSFGSWGAYQTSLRAQTARLIALAERNSMLVDGKLRKAASSLPIEDEKKMSSLIRYLLGTFGTSAVAPILSQEAMRASAIDKNDVYEYNWVEARARSITDAIGIRYYAYWESSRQPIFHYFNSQTGTKNPRVTTITGYDISMDFPSPWRKDGTKSPLRFDVDFTNKTIKFFMKGDLISEQSLDDYTKRLYEFIKVHPQETELPPDLSELEFEKSAVKVKLAITGCAGSETDKTFALSTFAGQAFVSFKQEELHKEFQAALDALKLKN